MKITQFASILVIAAAFVACAHKKTTTATTTAPTAKQEAAKGSKDAKAKAGTQAAPNAGSIVCKHGQDTRTVEVVTKGSGCEVSYTKFDQTSTPASSASGTAHCEAVKEKIKTNLENSGFKCE